MKKLYRSEKNKKLAGIFGGLSEVYEVDVTLLRLIFVFLLIFTGVFPFTLFYIIAAMIIPKQSELKSN